jgi:iron-regulated transporter 1
MTLKARLLLGRFLTRSGDQAWDFAVPIVLLKLFPGQLRVAALYFLVAKLLNVIVLPKLAALIDKLDRLTAARIGILLQFIGVVIGATAVYALSTTVGDGFDWANLKVETAFAALVFGGLISSLGSAFMDIAIANDLVPSSVAPDELPQFNSRLRQLDLFTEVSSPVVAGLLLAISQPPLLGFFLVAIWNLASFLPELLLIQSVLRDQPTLKQKSIVIAERTKRSMLQNLTGGWRAFFREPVALVALAYSFLWLSALSPHGVLLT